MNCQDLDGRITAEKADSEPSHDHTKHKGSGIAKEHFAPLAKHIMGYEREGRCSKGKGQYGIRNLADLQEQQTEQKTVQDAQAAAQAIHPINEIDCVDYADTSEDS